MRFRSSSNFLFLLVLLAGCGLVSDVFARGSHPYIGNWSNGRGETLVITADSLQFGDNDAVSFKDITKITDGNTFELHITEEGRINGVSGKYLSVSCERGKLQIRQLPFARGPVPGRELAERRDLVPRQGRRVGWELPVRPQDDFSFHAGFFQRACECADIRHQRPQCVTAVMETAATAPGRPRLSA